MNYQFNNKFNNVIINTYNDKNYSIKTFLAQNKSEKYIGSAINDLVQNNEFIEYENVLESMPFSISISDMEKYCVITAIITEENVNSVNLLFDDNSLVHLILPENKLFSYKNDNMNRQISRIELITIDNEIFSYILGGNNE